MDVERYEKAFLAVSAGLLCVFLAALVYATVAMGIHLPTRAGEIDPAAAMQTAPFDEHSDRRPSGRLLVLAR